MSEDAEKPRQYANGGIVRGDVKMFLPEGSYVIRGRRNTDLADLLGRLNRYTDDGPADD